METKIKNRGWVKNAAIILLAVLLVLTFFSNTILNRSLPEVATRSVMSGSINARIRVTGTVAANQSYEVSIDQSRRIRTVNVRVGQTVSAGDVLFVLSDAESAELESARETLRGLQKSYQTALINAAGDDYARENRNIQLAREALAEAEARLAANTWTEDELIAAEQAVVDAKLAVAAAQRAVTDRGKDQSHGQDGLTKAQEAVSEAQEVVSEAQAAVNEAQAAVNTAQAELDAAKSALAGFSPGAGDSETLERLQKAVDDAQAKLAEAKNDLQAAQLIHGNRYNWIKARAETSIKNTREYKALPENKKTQQKYIDENLPAYMKQVLYQIQQGLLFPYDTTEKPLDDGSYGLAPIQSEIDKYTDAYNAITSAEKAIDSAQEAYDEAVKAYNRAVENGAAQSAESTQEYNRLAANVKAAEDALETKTRALDAAKAALETAKAGLNAAKAAVDTAKAGLETAGDNVTDAQEALTAAQENQAKAEEALTAVRDKQTAYEAAEAAVREAEKNLGELLFSLQEQQKSDDRQAQLTALELQDLNAQIAKQAALIAELSADSGEKEVLADVSGTIETVSITAGQTTAPNMALATIELPDMGYTLTASVTNDQARRVHVGDAATVANYYWGSQIDAVVSGVRTDPKDPQNSKQLTFAVSGDVTPGTNLTLSVGQRSEDYDYVVPNSAIRSDTNGDFILVVVAKNSPLGDRYTATRVDVTRLANDDTSTAVSGALEWGDFAITTSTTPIKNGDRVRLADSVT